MLACASLLIRFGVPSAAAWGLDAAMLATAVAAPLVVVARDRRRVRAELLAEAERAVAGAPPVRVG